MGQGAATLLVLGRYWAFVLILPPPQALELISVSLLW